MDSRSEAQKKYEAEVDKQFKVINGATIIILKELHHWGDKRVRKVLDASDMVWKEIKTQGSMENIMAVCEKETGMVMTIKGKPYKDEDVFQYSWAERTKTPSQRDYIYECSRPWVASGFIASILIGLHRTEKWGKKKRLPEFLENINGVRGEWRGAYDYDRCLDKRYDIQLSLKE